MYAKIFSLLSYTPQVVDSVLFDFTAAIASPIGLPGLGYSNQTNYMVAQKFVLGSTKTITKVDIGFPGNNYTQIVGGSPSGVVTAYIVNDALGLPLGATQNYVDVLLTDYKAGTRVFNLPATTLNAGTYWVAFKINAHAVAWNAQGDISSLVAIGASLVFSASTEAGYPAAAYDISGTVTILGGHSHMKIWGH